MHEIVAKLDYLKVTWNFKNQSDLSKTGGRYRISALEPISSCRRVFRLEIINVTTDDEGVYSCHQTCKDSGGDVCKSSAEVEVKVYLPPPKVYSRLPTRGKKWLSACRSSKRNSKEFNFVLFDSLLEKAGPTSRHMAPWHIYKCIACLLSISRAFTFIKAQVSQSKRGV